MRYNQFAWIDRDIFKKNYLIENSYFTHVLYPIYSFPSLYSTQHLIISSSIFIHSISEGGCGNGQQWQLVFNKSPYLESSTWKAIGYWL